MWFYTVSNHWGLLITFETEGKPRILPNWPEMRHRISIRWTSKNSTSIESSTKNKFRCKSEAFFILFTVSWKIFWRVYQRLGEGLLRNLRVDEPWPQSICYSFNSSAGFFPMKRFVKYFCQSRIMRSNIWWRIYVKLDKFRWELKPSMLHYVIQHCKKQAFVLK